MRKNKSGFTLIELLIVVIIIVILAAIAIPKFRATDEGFYDDSLDSLNTVTADSLNAITADSLLNQ